MTVPGDPIVGFFSYSSIRYFSSSEKGFVDVGNVAMLVPCVIASLLLYCGGLILNDVFDLAEDRRERPDRPLAAGQINVKIATAVAAALLIGGIAAASFNGQLCGAIASLLALAVVCYNAGVKRIPIVGAFNMGLCRGLSVLLGLAISSSLSLGQSSPQSFLAMENIEMLLSWPFYSITPMILYVASVTFIASGETKTAKMRIRPWLPGIVAVAWMFCVFYPYPQWDNALDSACVILIAAVPAVGALACGGRLTGSPPPEKVQRAVGMLVGNLLLIQAAVVYFNSYSTNAHFEALPLAIALGLAYPIFLILCRRFYAS